MKNTLLFAALLALLTSCGEDKTQVEQLEKEVFAIHDEIMPKMGEIEDLKGELSTQLTTMDSLLKSKPDAELEKQKAAALQVTEALSDADKGMMDWMHDYKSEAVKTMSVPDATKYLNEEKTKIAAVRDQTLASISDAKKLLKK
jgi:hypothetical protein